MNVKGFEGYTLHLLGYYRESAKKKTGRIGLQLIYIVRKPITRNTLLHADSCHLSDVVRGVPKGYSFWDIKRAYDRAVGTSREDLLTVKSTKNYNRNSQKVPLPSRTPTERTSANNGFTRIIYTYSRDSLIVRKTVKKYWKILGQDPNLKYCPHNQNLHIKEDQKLRAALSMGFLEFVGNNSSRHFKIDFYANCGTKNVIYLITCQCGLQCIGKTIRPIRKRISEHLNCVYRHGSSSAVAKHLLEHHNGKLCLSFQVIDRFIPGARKGDMETLLLRKEAFWVYKLCTVVPKELNREWELNRFVD
ncbi:hypothetical protein XELAEV_18025626mg [Xenopus laevis]|uniref:GIY-YIG domain-containing protein n=1 Tax=Xenopus laevis TaxID=8355 RepID=A0A974HMH7_XENLA|nr:hypothetical protein XELAEV_18025626mg [Xenopus laevis]